MSRLLRDLQAPGSLPWFAVKSVRVFCAYNLSFSFPSVEILDVCCISQPAKVPRTERDLSCKSGGVFCHAQMINN